MIFLWMMRQLPYLPKAEKHLDWFHDRLPKDKHPFSRPNDDGDDDETKPIKTI